MSSKLDEIEAQLTNTDYGIPDWDVEWLIARARRWEKIEAALLCLVQDRGIDALARQPLEVHWQLAREALKEP